VLPAGLAPAAGLEWRIDEEATMPIYEYACKACGHEFETLVRSGNVPDCPTCHSTDLDKKLSVFATGGSSADATPVAAGSCGGCPHAGGAGTCRFD
jgi:putative FmdB family regulatory protein